VTVVAAPTITIDGEPVPISAAGGLPPLAAARDMSVTWGRAGVLDRPSPSRARLTLLDTGRGRPFASRDDLVGLVLALGWRIEPGPGAPVAETGTLFRGRITDVAVQRHTPANGPAGALVTLDASSLEVDVANYVFPRGGTSVWAAETFANRLTVIVAALPDSLLDPAQKATLHPAWTTWTAGALDASGADALTLLRRLYDSTGRVAQYQPLQSVFTYEQRPYVAEGVAGGDVRFMSSLQLQENGKYAAAMVLEDFPSSYVLDAAHLTGDVTADRSQRAAVTRVAVNWINGTATATTERAIPGADEDRWGRRALTIDTMHGTSAGAAACADEWVSRISAEGSLPTFDAPTYSTARNPFPDRATARLLLTGAQPAEYVFLRRQWLAEVGVTAVRKLIGATVGYARGQWTIRPTLAGAVNGNRPAGLVGRYAAADATVRLRDLDDTVTVADTRYVHMGAGFTPDTMPFLTESEVHPL
jgi:hypothetical protein